MAGSGEDFSPFAEGLVCGYEHGSSFVSCADELEEDAGLSLVLGDIGEVIEDQEMEAIEAVDGGFEGEFATRDLELLNEVGGRANRTRQPFSIRARPMRKPDGFCRRRWPEQQEICAAFDPCVAAAAMHLCL